MPGLTGAGGGETSASDASMLSTGGSMVTVLAVSEASLPLSVDVEVDLPESDPLSGPKWVSLNSIQPVVSREHSADGDDTYFW